MGSDEEPQPSLEISFGRSKAARAPKAAAEPGPESAPEKKPPRPEKQARPAKPAKVRHEKPVRDARPPREPYGIVLTSVIAGIVVGVALVGAGAGALRGCASVRGTSSCGGAGLPLLALILAGGVILGGVLLRMLSQTPSAMSISFLALAFVAVVSCLALLDVLDGWEAFVIVPALSVVGYLGAHLVTTRYIEPLNRT